MAKPVWELWEVLREGGSQEQPCGSAGASSGAAAQIKAREELSDAQKVLHRWGNWLTLHLNVAAGRERRSPSDLH